MKHGEVDCNTFGALNWARLCRTIATLKRELLFPRVCAKRNSSPRKADR